MEKPSDETVAEYFSRAQSLRKEILEIDSKALSEHALVAIVLNGLTDEYNVAVEVLFAKNEELAFKDTLEPIVNC